MEPLHLFKSLADETRLKIILLIHDEQELCVCELTAALDCSQPKISRHLAQLREAGVLSTRKLGQWVYYSLSDELPAWSREVIALTATNNRPVTAHCCQRLAGFDGRPARC